MTVEDVTDTEIRVRSSAGNLNVYTRDGNLRRTQLKSGELRTWDPFVPRFSYPLEPGKTWAQKFTSKRPGQENEVDATVTVVGWESVAVKAGTFNALKITYQGLYRNKDNGFRGREIVNLWYVPEIRRWVKLDLLDRGSNGVIYNDTTEELLSYSVK
jgi:hypothetical protein